jgi:flagellar hook-associated protein 1 FlgK
MSASLSASLAIAGSGLAAVNAQLALISQNVSNAGTPGYVTETLSQTNVTAGGVGEGVVTGVATRDIDLQAQQDLLAQNGVVSGLTTTQTALQSVDAAQGTVSSGNDLGSMVANLDAAFTTLQSDPSSSAQQSQVVDAAAQLAGQINQLGDAYATTRQSVQDTLVSNVNALNAALTSVGSLSDQIVAAKQRGQSTADLESQRDAVMQTVSSLVGVKYLEQPDGDMLVTTTSGLNLPIHGGPALSLSSAITGPDSSAELGSAPPIMLGGQNVTNLMLGGQIGAGVTLRDQTLPTYQAELDEFSENLSTRFADQGLALFTDGSGAVLSSGGSPAQAGYVGYSQSIMVNPAVVAAPTLVRDGTNAIAGSPTGASAFTPNTDPTQTGFTALITRVLNFTFGTQAQNGVAQPPAATTGLGPAGDLAARYNGAVSLSSLAASLVGAQSQDVANTTTQLKQEQAVQTTLQTQFSATTTVNTDTQLATMIQLQNLYGANAKVITAVQAMWADLEAAIT